MSTDVWRTTVVESLELYVDVLKDGEALGGGFEAYCPCPECEVSWRVLDFTRRYYVGRSWEARPNATV